MQNGPGVQPGDMALHFNPRWDDPHSPQPVIVRTHRQYGGWAAEDRSPVNFPFHRGHNFDLLILCDGAGWQVRNENFSNHSFFIKIKILFQLRLLLTDKLLPAIVIIYHVKQQTSSESLVTFMLKALDNSTHSYKSIYDNCLAKIYF